MDSSGAALRDLIDSIVTGDAASFQVQLARMPALARASFEQGVTRNAGEGSFIEPVKRWIISGDTALHFAAAAYRVDVIGALIAAGADIHARNRLGHTPLHAAAAGIPGSLSWNSQAQATSIAALIGAGADPERPNGNGSTPRMLASQNTGRGGSGSAEAKSQQQTILRLLNDVLGQTT